MEPSSAGQGRWRRQSERRTPNCRSDKTTIQRNDVPRGTMDETSSLWTLVSIALPISTRVSTRVRLFRLFLLIPCWESQRLIPKRSAGPRATKIGVVSLKALDHHRPNREESAPNPKARDLKRRTGDGRKRAEARGVKMGRRPKLTDHRKRDAIKRRDHGDETLAE